MDYHPYLSSIEPRLVAVEEEWGSDTITVALRFDRQMDAASSLLVSFGTEPPYEDGWALGEWQPGPGQAPGDGLTWVGHTGVVVERGEMTLSVSAGHGCAGHTMLPDTSHVLGRRLVYLPLITR